MRAQKFNACSCWLPGLTCAVLLAGTVATASVVVLFNVDTGDTRRQDRTLPPTQHCGLVPAEQNTRMPVDASQVWRHIKTCHNNAKFVFKNIPDIFLCCYQPWQVYSLINISTCHNTSEVAGRDTQLLVTSCIQVWYWAISVNTVPWSHLALPHDIIPAIV